MNSDFDTDLVQGNTFSYLEKWSTRTEILTWLLGFYSQIAPDFVPPIFVLPEVGSMTFP
jgi:hypothetical protein